MQPDANCRRQALTAIAVGHAIIAVRIHYTVYLFVWLRLYVHRLLWYSMELLVQGCTYHSPSSIGRPSASGSVTSVLLVEPS